MRTPIIFCILFYTLYVALVSSLLNAQDFEIEWENNAGGSQWDEFNDIKKTNDGGIICIGTTLSEDYDIIGNEELYDVLVQKYTSTGDVLWSKTYGGSNLDHDRYIVEKEDGSFIISCMTNSDDGDVSVNKGNYDIWIVHISSDGNLLWEKSFGGSGHDEHANVILKENGNYVIGASTVSGNGDVTNFHGGAPYSDYWLFEIDTIGNILWQNCFGSISEEE